VKIVNAYLVDLLMNYTLNNGSNFKMILSFYHAKSQP